MEITNKHILVSFIILIVITLLTLNNIRTFMPIEKTCEDDFAMINKCGCIPCDNGLIKFLGNTNTCQNIVQKSDLKPHG